jgi:hypothetical protein
MLILLDAARSKRHRFGASGPELASEAFQTSPLSGRGHLIAAVDKQAHAHPRSARHLINRLQALCRGSGVAPQSIQWGYSPQRDTLCNHNPKKLFVNEPPVSAVFIVGSRTPHGVSLMNINVYDPESFPWNSSIQDCVVPVRRISVPSQIAEVSS